VDDYEHYEGYRSELAAALVRIEQLEQELDLFRTDPAFERVDIAQEELSRARERRRRLQKILPRVCIASFVAMGTFALAEASLPPFVTFMAYAICALGIASAATTMVWMLVLAAQGERPKRLAELERRVRIAKGDVGKRWRVENDDASIRVGRTAAPRIREQEGATDEFGAIESADRLAHEHGRGL